MIIPSGRSSTRGSYQSGKVYPNTTRFDGLNPGPVHFNDGAYADGKYLKAITLYFRQHKHAGGPLFGSTPTLAGESAELFSCFVSLVLLILSCVICTVNVGLIPESIVFLSTTKYFFFFKGKKLI